MKYSRNLLVALAGIADKSSFLVRYDISNAKVLDEIELDDKPQHCEIISNLIGNKKNKNRHILVVLYKSSPEVSFFDAQTLKLLHSISCSSPVTQFRQSVDRADKNKIFIGAICDNGQIEVLKIDNVPKIIITIPPQVRRKIHGEILTE